MAVTFDGKTGTRAGTLVSMLAPVVLTIGCRDIGPLSDNEMGRLQQFALSRAVLPADPSNGKADDVAAAKLGKLLYFDTRFSGPLGPYNLGTGNNGSLGGAGDAGKVGCASCHDPATGGTDHRSLPSATSLGAGYTARNSPSVINAAYAPLWQFWDGRKDSLWSQALTPPEGDSEGNSNRLAVVHLLADRYSAPYATIFGPLPLADLTDTVRFPRAGKPGDDAFDEMYEADQRTVNEIFANFGKAIAAYERRLVSPNFEPSAFDAFMNGREDAMTPGAIRGAKLFIGHAGCAECHSGPLFTDFAFHNIGAPQHGEYVPATDNGRLDGIDALKSDPFNRAGTFSDAVDSAHLDGLQPTTALTDEQRQALAGQFKTPALRNVSKTAPYMHDGAYQSLWDVVNHYNFGGETGSYAGEKDPAVSPLLLSNDELGDLVEFLEALADGDPLTTTAITTDFPEGLTKPPGALP